MIPYSLKKFLAGDINSLNLLVEITFRVVVTIFDQVHDVETIHVLH